MTTEPSSPNVTTAIVAHTKRAKQAHKLMADTGAAFMSIDNGTLGCENNHRRTWQWLAQFTPTTWALVLEDDAQPVTGFNNQVTLALAKAPTPIVSLYLGQQRPPHWQPHIHTATQQATNTDAHWITGTHLLHAVAVAIHTELINDMLHHTTNTQHPWDYAIGAWAQSLDLHISYTWPSLVDHEDGDTITRHKDKTPRTPGRKAWNVGERTNWENTRTVQLTTA